MNLKQLRAKKKSNCLFFSAFTLRFYFPADCFKYSLNEVLEAFDITFISDTKVFLAFFRLALDTIDILGSPSLAFFTLELNILAFGVVSRILTGVFS